MSKSLDIVQHNHRPVRKRKAAERFLKIEPLCCVGRIEPHAVRVAEFEQWVPPPDGFPRHSHTDSLQPCGECRFTTKRSEPCDCPHPGILNRVIRVRLLTAEHTELQCAQAWRVPAVERTERRLISQRHGRQQHLVGLTVRCCQSHDIPECPEKHETLRHYHSPVPTDLAARFRAARTDPALAVLEGFHAIKHGIRFGAEFQSVVTRNSSDLRLLAEQLAPDVSARLAALATEVPGDRFDDLSPTPPETGVIAMARRPASTSAKLGALSRNAPIILLESPSHSGNIGAVIRVAAGAGAAAVITTGPNDPWNPGAIRGSAGLHFALPVIRSDMVEVEGRPLIAIDPDGDNLVADSIPDDAVLAFGSERSGLSGALLARASRRVRIPMEPGVSSLNLATSVAIVLYGWRLRR